LLKWKQQVQICHVQSKASTWICEQFTSFRRRTVTRSLFAWCRSLSARRSRNQSCPTRKDSVLEPVDQKALRRRAGKYLLRLRRPRGNSGVRMEQWILVKEQSHSLRSMVKVCDVAARNPRKDCRNRPGVQPLDCVRWCGVPVSWGIAPRWYGSRRWRFGHRAVTAMAKGPLHTSPGKRPGQSAVSESE